MLAEVAARLGRYADAEVLLERCSGACAQLPGRETQLRIRAPPAEPPEKALAQLERLLANDPRNPGYRNMQAAVLSRVGEYDRSLKIYAEVLAEYPHNAKVWMSYGHALKAAGRQSECVATYRRAIELASNLGEAYWSLANLKTFRFTADDIETMQAQLRRTDLSEEDRFHFHFSLGKAREDAGRLRRLVRALRARQPVCGASVDQLRCRGELPARATLETVADARSFSPRGRGWVRARPIRFSSSACRAPGPRCWNRSSPAIRWWKARWSCRTSSRWRDRSAASGARARDEYPEALADLSADELRALGQQYIADTRIQRKTDAPFFIDKMPNNFAHIGLIHLILPRAKIIDARRHPLGCCFSGFKQHFARGQHFTYGLEDIGRYYRDYVELMAHFDAVLPGRVHRVIYETMVDDTENEVRRLLDYCGLPFDERCLRFYENDRAVRTASSEQVRQPIYRDGRRSLAALRALARAAQAGAGTGIAVLSATPQFEAAIV